MSVDRRGFLGAMAGLGALVGLPVRAAAEQPAAIVEPPELPAPVPWAQGHRVRIDGQDTRAIGVQMSVSRDGGLARSYCRVELVESLPVPREIGRRYLVEVLAPDRTYSAHVYLQGYYIELRVGERRTETYEFSGDSWVVSAL